MTAFKDLKTISLIDSRKVFTGEKEINLTTESPASSVITDFNYKRPTMLEQDVGIDAALMVMRKTHVRSVLVIDQDENFQGLVTLANLESDKVLALTHSMGVSRSDITIRDVMTSKEKLQGVDIETVYHSKIGDLLTTFQHVGCPHILLTGKDKDIQGIVSASEVARQLHIDINIQERVVSFADIYGVVARGKEV
jgi:CBS domain containing-hemolysin-like protein